MVNPRLPLLATLLEQAYASRGGGIAGPWLPSFFKRAPSRGQRARALDRSLLWPDELRAALGPRGAEALLAVEDPASFVSCGEAREVLPTADLAWLAQARQLLARHPHGRALSAALQAAYDELHALALAELRPLPVGTARRVLDGLFDDAQLVQPFAAVFLKVLAVGQEVYIAARLAGADHGRAASLVTLRLFDSHPTGQDAERGPYLRSLILGARSNGLKRLERNSGKGQQESARALLAGALHAAEALWPWRSARGAPLPSVAGTLTLREVAACLASLLRLVASDRRGHGGLREVFAAAGFGGQEWLADRAEVVALLLDLIALAPEGTGEASEPWETLTLDEAYGRTTEAATVLLRAALSTRPSPRDGALISAKMARAGGQIAAAEVAAMVAAARPRLREMLAWLEPRARDLLPR